MCALQLNTVFVPGLYLAAGGLLGSILSAGGAADCSFGLADWSSVECVAAAPAFR
jgi:hypothetical protein